MLSNDHRGRLCLPEGWAGCVKSAVLHVLGLAHYAIAVARG